MTNLDDTRLTEAIARTHSFSPIVAGIKLGASGTSDALVWWALNYGQDSIPTLVEAAKRLAAVMPLLKELALDADGDVLRVSTATPSRETCAFCFSGGGNHFEDCPGVKAAALVEQWEAKK